MGVVGVEERGGGGRSGEEVGGMEIVRGGLEVVRGWDDGGVVWSWVGNHELED